jgi:hypothetical protein
MIELEPAPTIWDLFVDESGDFDDPERKVVVAAVLVPFGARENTHGLIRAEILERVKPIAWPPHRRVLRPALVGLSWWHQLQREGIRAPSDWAAGVKDMLATLPKPMRQVIQRLLVEVALPTNAAGLLEPLAGNPRPVPMAFCSIVHFAIARRVAPSVVLAAADLAERIQRAAPDLLHAIESRLDAGLEPRDRDLDVADSSLGLCLDSTRRALESAVRASLASLTDYFGRLPGVQVFVSSESRIGDAVPDLPGPPHHDRYTSLLAILLQRVEDALGRLPGEHQVRLHVAERLAPDATTGHVRILDKSMVRAVTPPTTPPVAWDVHWVGPYGPASRAGLVLAYFAASPARHALANQTLEQTLEYVRRATNFQPNSGTPALPHLAASGGPDAWLRSVRSTTGDVGRPGAAQNPTWPWQQANAWADAWRLRI